MRKTLVAMAALAVGLLALPAQADVIIGKFTIQEGAPGPLGGEILLSLNEDGTIAATLTSVFAPIGFFGLDSAAFPAQSDFHPTAVTEVSIGDLYGGHPTGFQCSCGFSESWTYGAPGQFASVFDIIGGVHSDYDFFLWAGGVNWAANAEGVPEPLSAAVVAAGLVGAASLRRRKRAQR